MAPHWLFQIQLFPWLPFLVYQAKNIRKSSQKLPAQSPLLTLGQGEKHVVLLGESSVAGVGASSASTSLAGNFSRIFGDSYQIETIGKKGLRVKEAFSLYLKHKNSESKKSEGVLLFLGANDCFLLTSPKVFKKTRILDSANSGFHQCRMDLPSSDSTGAPISGLFRKNEVFPLQATELFIA